MKLFLERLSDAATTSLGFFWKAAWAFVLGYAVSATIQVMVPKARLTRFLGDPGVKSVGLATLFGSISSSCSFAALAAGRALLRKGAHFVATVAFLFASTNLVIELGALILVFLGWEYLVAELAGGVLMIAVSTLLVRATYPRRWIEAARERVEDDGDAQEDDFDWRRRLRSRDGWKQVGRRFGMEWGMVWQEIVIGFTVAGLVAVLVPASFWKAVFLSERASVSPGDFLLVLQNAAVAPLAAAATFIGSMGNIPLATVLASSGVLFAGVMGFIYSDLMVPPLVRIHAKYYGWRVALYIAAVMYASIVITAVTLHYIFLWAGRTPETGREVAEVTRFAVDYTLWLNLAAALTVGLMAWLARSTAGHAGHGEGGHDHGDHDHGGRRQGGRVQKAIALACILALAAGGVAALF